MATTPPRTRAAGRRSETARARLLVVHQDAPTLLAIKRGLEGGALAEAVGARSPSAALDRLRDGTPPDAVLLFWRLPDHGALQFIWALDQLGLARRPFLLAFADQWPEDDLSRAMQLGVDGFFPYPLDAARVVSELGTLRATGQAPSRTRLLHKGADRLLRPNDRLWSSIDVDPDWRARMVSLADVVTGRASRALDEPDSVVLRALDAALGYPVPADLVKALVVISREGPERVDLVARTLNLGASRIRRSYRAALQALRPAGGPPPADFTTILAKVLRLVEQRAAEVELSPAFRRVRQAASAMVVSRDEAASAAARADFDRALGQALRCDVQALADVQPDLAMRLARELVSATQEGRALDRVRLRLLSWSLRGVDGPVDVGKLKVAAAVLGSAGDDPLQVDRLLAVASGEDEDALRGLGKAPMDAIRRGLATLTGHAATAFNPVELARRIDRVVRAVESGGEIQQLRLAEILDHVERQTEDNLRTSARHALFDNLGLPPHLRGTDATLLWDALGVIDAEQEARLAAFVDNLLPDERFTAIELTEAARRANDADDFEDWSRGRAVTPVLDAGEGQGNGRARAALVGLVDALELPAQMVDRVALGELSAALAGPAPATHLEAAALARLQALASTLRASDAPTQDTLIDRFVATCDGDSEQARVLLALLPDDHALRARVRTATGLRDAVSTPETVDTMLSEGNLMAAHIAVDELADDEPRTVPALTKVALAMEEQGRVPTAIALLERALALQPRRLNLLLHLARLKARVEAWRDAYDLLARLREVAPGFGDTEALWSEVRAHTAG
ncbi:MAG: hypothetical protein H6704_22715 [Myxococcales bacterium]|nr:hypothetical protein [Myxococcales bacterium]